MRVIVGLICGAPVGFALTLIALYVIDAISPASTSHDDVVMSGASMALGASVYGGAFVGLLVGVWFEIRAVRRRISPDDL
jgi:hypothetical protein